MKELFFTIILFFCVLTISSQEVVAVSAMKKVIMGQDLSNHISWDTIPRQHLFAVSPLGRIEGEVTIIDGEMFTSKVNEQGKVEIARQWGVKSPFAVYASVSSWRLFEAEASVRNEFELQNLIETIAQREGYDISRPLSFQVEGVFDLVGYHIISKPTAEKEHNQELHYKAKKMFYLKEVSGKIIGFYSQNHEGIFTHKGQFIHAHFVDDLRTHMGHLDEITIIRKIKLYLPTINTQ
jgi:acetolactate decarboxylase